MKFNKKLAQKFKMALHRGTTRANNSGVEKREAIIPQRSYSKLICLGKRTLKNREAIEKTSLFKSRVIFGSKEDRRIYLCFSKIKFLNTIEVDHDETLWIKEKDGPVWVYPGGTKVAYDSEYIENYMVKPSSTIDYKPTSNSPLNQITSNKQPIHKYSLGYVDDVSTLANGETDPDHRYTSFWASSQVTIGSNVATIAPSQTQIQHSDSSGSPINTVPTPLVWAMVRDISGIIVHVKAVAVAITAAATGIKLLTEFWRKNREQCEEYPENQNLDGNIPLLVEIPAIVRVEDETM